MNPYPYLQIILQSVSVYIIIVVAIRLFGKKELTQLSVFDLVFILLISNSVQNAMVEVNDSAGKVNPWLGGVIAAVSLFSINYILKYFLYRNKGLGKFLQGTPVMLIHKGVAIPEHLKQLEITMNELEAAIREHGVEKISDVDLAVLEVDGNISVMSHNYQHKTVRRRKAHKALNKTS